MNRKRIIIFSILIFLTVIIAGCVVYFINQSDTKKISKPEISSSNYYIEQGAEDYAKIVTPAVESYATQDVSESLASRNSRLATYFTKDSPVFSRDIEIRSTNTAIKTEAKATSVTFPTGQGLYQTLIVKADVTSYAGSNSSTISQTYWIAVKQNSDSTYVAYDIGSMNK